MKFKIATKNSGIEKVTTVSIGDRKAEVIVLLEGMEFPAPQTRHLRLEMGQWRDALNNVYQLEA